MQIQIHVQPLAQFILKQKQQFSNFAEFNQYKKNTIYAHRNTFISNFLNRTICNHDIQPTEFGKPYLSNTPQFSFNHSHSQYHYALAMSNNVVDLGVDIEDLDRQVRFDALAKHAFHPSEYEAWQAFGCDPTYWFKVWTTKEAVLKASGLGIRMDLKDLNTHAHPLQNQGWCEHEKVGVFAYQNFNLQGCMLTIAWRTEHAAQDSALPNIEIVQH